MDSDSHHCPLFLHHDNFFNHLHKLNLSLVLLKNQGKTMRLLLPFLFLFSFNTFANDDFKEMLERYLEFNKQRAEYLVSTKDNIVGVEIIIADEANNLASRFGHALLRFVDKDGLWANDAVVSFGALSEEENYSIWKGIFGGYPFLPQVMNLHEYWTQYTKTEKRDLKRYVLNLSPDQLDKFLNISFDYILHPEKLKNYTFTKNNCVGVVSKFLIEAGLTVDDKQAIVPNNVHKWLKRNSLTVFPVFTMKNPAALEKRIAETDLNEISADELVKNFNDSELSYIYLNKTDLSFEHFLFLSEYLPKKKVDIDDAFSFTDISLDLYDRCQSLVCFRRFNEAEKKMKIADQLDIISYRLGEDNDLQKLYLNHREFQKWNMVKIQDLTVRNNKFTLVRKKEKIYFQAYANPTRIEDRHLSKRLNVALQFQIEGKKVLLLDEEVGVLGNKGLELHKNFRLILHNDKDEQVLALIKI